MHRTLPSIPVHLVVEAEEDRGSNAAIRSAWARIQASCDPETIRTVSEQHQVSIGIRPFDTSPVSSEVGNAWFQV